MELKHSNTAFLVACDTGYDLRWFTPQTEVALCGHATLASAIVLAEMGRLEDTIDFQTQSGTLTIKRTGDAFVLDFPALSSNACAPPSGLLDALGVQNAYVAASKLDLLVEVESADIVRKLTPDFKSLANIKTRGVIVTSRADNSDYDIVSRFFAPAIGIDEDPVTGSAHCVLATHWNAKLGKSKMRAAQLSARGGAIQVELVGDRVKLTGQGVIFSQGEIRVYPSDSQ
jgi:PhzF family phenazine biosynthesis protein